MTLPVVTEIRQQLEAVAHDDFIDNLEPAPADDPPSSQLPSAA